MSSASKNSKISLTKKSTPKTARRTTTRRKRLHARAFKAQIRRRSYSNSKVSDKLEALKNLIPAPNGETLKAEQLFQETADYIVLLRTRIFVLQRLIDFYGSSTNSSISSSGGGDDSTTQEANNNAVS